MDSQSAELVISKVLVGEEVRVPTSPMSVKWIREIIHKQVLKQTTEPIEIITGPRCDYLIIRKMDMSKVRPFSELEEMARNGKESR